MNLLTLKRTIYSDRSTIGALYLEGNKFCDTIELSCRKGDEKGLLAICPGRYDMILSMSPRLAFVTPEILKVPRMTGGFRTGIRIHPANWASQLDGCIAPGLYDPKVRDFVANSRSAFRRLMDELESRPVPWQFDVSGGREFPKAVA